MANIVESNALVKATTDMALNASAKRSPFLLDRTDGISGLVSLFSRAERSPPAIRASRSELMANFDSVREA